LQAKLAGLFKARDEAGNSERNLKAQEEERVRAAALQLREKLAAELKRVSLEAFIQKRNILEPRFKRRTDLVQTAYSRQKARIEAEAQAQFEHREQLQREAHAKIIAKNEVTVAEARARHDQRTAELAKFEADAQRFLRAEAEYRRRYGAVPAAVPAELPADLHAAITEVERQLHETDAVLSEAARTFGRRLSPLVASLLAIVIHAGAAAGVYFGLPSNPLIFAVPLSLVIVLAIIQNRWNSVRERGQAVTQKLSACAVAANSVIARKNSALKEMLDKELADIEGEMIKRICGIVDEEIVRQAQDAVRATTDAGKRAHYRYEELLQKVNRGNRQAQAKLAQDTERTLHELRENCRRALVLERQQCTARMKQIADDTRQQIDQLAEDWKQALADFTGLSEELLRVCRSQNPAWAEIARKEWTLSEQFASTVHAGNMVLNPRQILSGFDKDGRFSVPAGDVAFPLSLSFPLKGSLYIRASQKRRDEAQSVLFTAVLRLLCSFPPAKMKLTIVDPVGLGQSFAALMHLCDYDESLVNGKIWTDGIHIERKLTELTEHMEKIIQKYLRNKYASIDEYNQQAGQLAEPYRFLVITDFPTGFSDLALERLASIVSTGVRCGVYCMILQDARQKLPPQIPEMQIRRSGLLVVEREGVLCFEEEGLPRARFSGQTPPPSDMIDTLVHSVGKQCQQAARVQVPFAAATPKPEEFWTSNSEKGIRVPLGKAGADRMQYMQLGSATAQHALIAGKTGSGKSNLFHVIITNAAMWYSPKEIEFYLIDFKKGVEFKTYGVHQLAHARVVAIESDREFGLSVLRRIDKELTYRGELFRKARVQDFASYRKCEGAVHLPRTVLMIDEFQEYFTDDDEVAQDATLLLDRVVRQGRAFGIHVILGSQTLGGTYSLAKSTLGQITVRIALQCNESDSYLILGDDNSAASLLSRPGEAIYNDMSGMIEGNSPFQVVYLSKEAQDACLSSLQQKSAADGLQAVGPSTIFEGNNLSDLRSNRVLNELVGRGPKALPALKSASAGPLSRVWLGEANAIKGPTEVEFPRQAGSNLLVIGQRGDTELSMCCSAILSLAACNEPKDIRILVLDGTAPESGTRERLAQLAAALPHKIEIVDYRNVPDALGELAALVRPAKVEKPKSNDDDDDDNDKPAVEAAPPQKTLGLTLGPSHFLMVLGLEKFRMLRQDDDFSFSGDEAAAPAKSFVDILTEGPREGVFTIIWCDTLNTLNRTFSRKTLREFEWRVLFQMSASDSSDLIDSPAANRLGLYNALLFSLQTGGIEKFRPYSQPDADLVEELAGKMKR
jgi:hypothetical protein